jgi:hypothetical protein
MVSLLKAEFEHVQLRAEYALFGEAVKDFFERVQVIATWQLPNADWKI